MSTIVIRDLPECLNLDREAMAQVTGASGAPWVYGWIRPFVAASSSQSPVINFYQINNFAEQMINQFQLVNVSNTGSNANVNVGVDERSTNNAVAPKPLTI
jgi:hypothetical protein